MRLVSVLLVIAALLPPSTLYAQITRTNRVADASGTVATGGTSQTAMPVNADRAGLLCLNPIDASEALFINFGAAASTTAKTSIELAPGGSLTMMGSAVPTTTVTVTAVTTGHAYVCKEFLNQ